MKRLISLILILSPNIIFGQKKLACKEKLANGQFMLLDSISGNTTIERKGRFQIEKGEKSLLKVKLRITWIDDCTYSLQLIKVIENPNHLPLPSNAKDIVLKVEVLSLTNDSYEEITSSNLSDVTRKRTILIK